MIGTLASMAQNEYGVTILIGVAAAFSILFFVQLALLLSTKEKTSLEDTLELTSLSILSAVMTLRAAYIRVGFTEIIFTAAGLVLVTSLVWRALKHRNQMLAAGS